MVFVVQALLDSLGLAVARRLVPGLHLDSAIMLVLVSLLIGLADAAALPALRRLSVPLTLLTAGLFVLVVNGLIFTVGAALVPHFSVASVGAAVAATLVVSFVSLFLTWFVNDSLSR